MTDPNPLQERIAGKLCDPARHVAHWPLVGIDPYCDQCYTQAAAVLPIIAAEVRKAQGDALRAAAREMVWDNDAERLDELADDIEQED